MAKYSFELKKKIVSVDCIINEICRANLSVSNFNQIKKDPIQIESS